MEQGVTAGEGVTLTLPPRLRRSKRSDECRVVSKRCYTDEGVTRNLTPAPSPYWRAVIGEDASGFDAACRPRCYREDGMYAVRTTEGDASAQDVTRRCYMDEGVTDDQDVT